VLYSQNYELLCTLKSEAEKKLWGTLMNNDIEQVYIALENKERYLARQTIVTSFREALDVLLAIAEALVQDIPDDVVARESIAGQRLAELPCHILGCQHVTIAVVEQQSDILYPIGVAGITSEHEQQWREGIGGVRIQSLLGDTHQRSQLQMGEILTLDMASTVMKSFSSVVVLAPICRGEQLLGLLLLDYGHVHPRHTSDELALIKAVSTLAALIIEREKAQRERDKALTALREANEQLEHMNKSKSEFISLVSHDFRSTLTTIQGFSEMMCQEDLSIADMKEFAVDIHLDAQRLSHMVSDMLDLERLETGRMHLTYGWLDLNTILTEVVQRMRLTIEHHTIQLKLANALPVLMGDAEKLTYVIEILLNNAIKYSPDGGEVCISSAVEAGAVHVCVQDNGIGIPADAINSIFERYEHVGTDAKRTFTGTGLSTVRQIVRMHGGQVWAESVLGEGSLFHFTVQFVNGPAHINSLLS